MLGRHVCVGLLSLIALLACARAYEDMPAAPQALKLEVVASEGGTATLRCLFYGNPTPKITWRFRAHNIDGNTDRYRLISDGALEINPLYRSDTGVYTCVADNGLGAAMQEVHLAVNDLSAPHQVVPQKQLVASEGGTAALRYLLPGNPPPTITRKFRQLGIHQLRTRHKRKSSGLYLPASYVIPGGEGGGPWGEWGEVSHCSRTCGGGVASQKRICLQSGPEEPQCTGGDTKYFSCQTQDCPDGSGDFRAQQCAEFNDKTFKGLKNNWVPYTKAPNPCELNCMPHGERFYFRHKLQVTDGTRCNDESFDVCVNGKCQPVGCDMMLNSTAREDKCRVCRGNGTNCRTTDGIFDSQDLMKGYNDILLIPAGSTSIYIEEVEPSNNYLVLRAKNGTYYLNGHYHIDFPRTIMIAGALWTYERSQQGFAAPDKLQSLGPTTEPLYLSLLLQDENVGIKYEFSVPNNSALPTDKQYSWVHKEFTPCSATCGGGFQTRNVTCRTREELEIVDTSLCDEGLRPSANQSCSSDPCPAQWVEGPWGQCSQKCGSEGVKSREVTCQKIIANGIKSIVPDKECFDLLGPKPKVFQKCNEDAPCPTWFVGHWRPCNKLCDEGKQTRQVVCYQNKNGRIKVLDDENCTEVKPEEEQPCMLQPCDEVDWITSSWFGCDSCTSKFRTRTVVCATKSQQVLNESFCSHFHRPADHEECDKDVLPACEVQWYATQWSRCSVNCGDGVQTRKVFCGISFDDKSGEGVDAVKDAKCANLTKYNDTKPCTVPKEECPSKWFAGSWSACTKACGGGEQFRRVMCFRGDIEATDCDRSTVLESLQFCNTGSCHPDPVRMPVGIAGDENATVIGELDSPLRVRCLAYGYPPPIVYWYSSNAEDMALYNDTEHEVIGNDLIFRNLNIDTLGQYSCRAYNGVGKAASWGLVVRAYKPKGLFIENEWLVPRPTVESRPRTQPPINATTTTTTNTTITTITINEAPLFIDPVRMPVGIAGDENATVIGELDSPLHVRCLAYGYPPPIVYWYSSNAEDMALYNDTEHEVIGNDLIFRNLNIDTLGQYSCRAYNGVGKEASWGLVVRAYKPKGLFIENEWLVPRPTVESRPRTQPPINATTTTTTNTTITINEAPLFIETSTAGVLTETTEETTELFETSERSSTNEDTTGVISATTLDPCSGFQFGCSADNKTKASGPDGEGCPCNATEFGCCPDGVSPDPVRMPVGIAGDENATVIGELDSPLHVRCLAYGYPPPIVYWYSSNAEDMALYNDTEHEVIGNDLIFRNLNIDTLGQYSCRAHNGVGKEASWGLVVRAYKPKGLFIENEWLVPRPTVESRPRTQPPINATTTTTTNTTITINEAPLFIETSTAGVLTETTEETTELFETSERSSTNEDTTGVISATTLDPCSGFQFGCCADNKTKASGPDGEGCPCNATEFGCCPDGVSPDPVRMPVGIAGDENATVIGELDSPLHVRCLAYGYPPPIVYWYSSNAEDMALYNDTEHEVIGNDLIFRNLNIDTLGQYSCRAHNGVGKEASWGLVVRAYKPKGLFIENEWLVPRPTVESRPRTQPPINATTTTTTYTTITINEAPLFIETSTAGVLTETTEETTELFETSERSSTNEDTTGVISATTLDPCSGFQFGCCADNKTKASGPDGEGCPCNATEFGCCPDGVSPETSTTGGLTETTKETAASFETNERSTTNEDTSEVISATTLDPCSGFQFGCCADNKTKASGPDGEGCPCNATEFGCCPDGLSPETSTTGGLTETTEETTESFETSETTKEDTTDVISTTTLDPCSGFEFGCCADNETEALGPGGQGCPCNATEFGCCPDGVSPATGREVEDCAGPCSTSLYGCCQDDKTPAHGPELEGCCLLQAFQCCPDNRKPAEGAHLEGCECQYVLHGCCPDNVTIAQGADSRGCGCQYTQHGCCPDRRTTASGPNNEGCACNTYQFGCCFDGVTIAKGPKQQGCHCRESKFGCCGDGETHATSPDAAGCDCSSSRHGCCPDGRTEATGPKFLGCTDAPENKQAACSMSTDPGPCHNFMAMWYYDMAYGGCSRFWYGGCDGNGNRFSTKEECEDVCVQPSPKDACKLPSVKGACDADYQRWHYNSTREQCIPFRYGGCLGNANNFDTLELCQKQCEPSSVAGQCNLPIDQGSCAGNYSRWGFNSEAHRCEQFIWGGCEGNSNRFSSEAACQMRCAGTQPPQCTQPQEAGNCTEKEALWSFSQSENRCLPFYYSGCGGNDNRFSSRETCEQTCPSAFAPDKCTLPNETGQCSNYRERWFYDTTFKRCRQFYYGGCGGNENNFGTEAECDNSCSEIKTTTTATITTTITTARLVEPQTQPPTAEPEQRPAAPERSEFCFNAIDAGPCNNAEPRYAYDSELGRCVTFQYGGCGGNQNNFPDETYCSFYCQPMQDICQLPMLQGPCDDSLMRWFYDPTTGSCSQFTYGGCEGNDNRFESLEACESRCRTGPAPVEPTTPSTTIIVDGSSECRVPEALEDCRYGGEVWYFDPSRHECVSHANQEAGPVCRYTGTFLSQEACERSCGAFRGVDVCKQRKDPGPCQSHVTKAYFDQSTGQCHEFIYGGCLGGANRFSSIEECSQVCKAEIADPCTLPPEGGNCFLYVQQWYYDPSRDQCNQFVYTGCSGNENRFETQRDCEARCKRPASTTTTVANSPQQRAEPECKTPSSLAPCGNNVTVFYYDSERRQCLMSGFGGCGHPNTYRTEEECERSCGAFRGMDVCGAHLDPGPCRASINKIYWDAISGSCQPYAYGGCAGGPNRFSNVEDCMSVCGDTGPETNEVYDCDEYVANCSRLRCEYGIQRTRTPDGCEKCSCVQVEIDCEPLKQECDQLKCNYGIERIIGPDGCEGCKCKEYPCEMKTCGAGERCVVHPYMDGLDPEPKFTAECRIVVKPGACPMDETTTNEVTCRRECSDDADCRGVGKCCRQGCSDICLAPVEQTSPHALLTTTVAPNVPAAPQALPQPEPEVAATEGGTATLRCLFHGNPPPKITWRLGELTIDGNAGRYRLMSDGALEIVSLYRNDTGVYICVADNGLGVATQEVHLAVNDPVRIPVGIAGDENAVVTGELGRPLHVRCLAYGYPPPSVFWYRGYESVMVPYNDAVYEASGNVLLIRSLALETLGQYTCQAYNGEGKAASWVVFVRAYMPEGLVIDNELLVPRNTVVPRPRTLPPTTAETTTTTTTTTTVAPRPLFTVPVSTYVSTPSPKPNSGTDLHLTCEVDGFPEPDVHWTKDGGTIQTDNRITITGSTIVSRLTVMRVTVADSGLYACHASNPYSSQSDTAQINVQQLVVPAKCTDNHLFANCDLIVRSKFCRHKYYSKFCCKSCVEAGQLDPQEAELQADQPLRKK